MLVRWRRLPHAASYRAVETVSVPRVGTPERSSLFTLIPRDVELTLSNCPSDVVALSFFLWCARQPDYFHGPQAFNRMVPVLGRLTERFGSVAGILREMESVGCPRKAQTFLILMRIYWRGGMHRLVLEAFDEMAVHNYAPNTFARNIVLDVLFKIGSIRRAFEFFKDTQAPNFLTFNTAICNLCGPVLFTEGGEDKGDVSARGLHGRLWCHMGAFYGSMITFSLGTYLLERQLIQIE